MDPIEVTAHFDEHGKVTPLRFTWKGSAYQVESTGRRWSDANGQHILVMVPGGRIFALSFVNAEARWYLERVGPNRMVA